MRKKFLYAGLAFVVILAIFFYFACGQNNASVSEAYFHQINSLIKDFEFDTAQVVDEKIVLYNSEHEVTQEIRFDDYNDKIQLVAIRKDGGLIYFVTGGSVDDEIGIIFINDHSNNIFDGIKSIKRIGGNSYRYSTSE